MLTLIFCWYKRLYNYNFNHTKVYEKQFIHKTFYNFKVIRKKIATSYMQIGNSESAKFFAKINIFSDISLLILRQQKH